MEELEQRQFKVVKVTQAEFHLFILSFIPSLKVTYLLSTEYVLDHGARNWAE